MDRRTLFPFIALMGALGMLAACLLALSGGNSARAAPLHQGTGEDPGFRALTVTADLPISDTRPYQAVTKTVYFNNSGSGIITLTVDLTGTPPLTLTAGAAFGEGERMYTSTDSPATFVVTYEVGALHGDQPGVPYTATNGDGLEVTLAITYIRDITAPTAAIVTPNADRWISTTLEITGTAADNDGGTGVAVVSITTGTAWVPAGGISPWAYTWAPPGGQNGTPYTFSVRAADFVGNAQSPAATRRITVDNVMTGTVHGLTSTTHLTGVWSNRTVITVTWNPADDGSGIGLDGYSAIWDTSPDTSAPMAQSLDASATMTSKTLSEGDHHYFHIRAADGLGNWADTGLTRHLGPFRIDTTPPGVTLTHPASGAVLTATHRPDVTLIVTATDARSGVAWVDVSTDNGTTWVSATLGPSGWSWTWTLPEVDRQVYTLTARAYDNAGNPEVSAGVPVTVDTVAPGASAPQPHRSPWVTSTVVYTWIPSSDGSDILGYQVNITNTAGYTALFWTDQSVLTFTEALTEGAGYYARVLAVDGVGNNGDWSGPSTVVTSDLTKPTISNPQISIGSGVTYFYVSGLTLFYTNTMPSADSFTVKGNASDSGSGLERATFSEAFGQTLGDDTTPSAFSGSYDVSPDATESGNITVTVYDKAGNTATQIYTYTLDGEGPYTGSVVIQGGAAYVSGTNVSLAIFAADAGCGVARMCITNTFALCDAWEPYTTNCFWTLEGADGKKTVYAWFRDHLGNTSGPYTDTVVLDRLAPSGSITINNGAAYATQVTVTLTLTATDGTSGLDAMCLSNEGLPCNQWEPFTATKQWTLDETADGLKTVHVQYRDRAGNVANNSDTILLDRRPPVVTVTVPPTSPVPFVVAWEGKDPEPGSGVVSYSVAYSVTGWVLWFPSTTLTSATFYTATPGQTAVFSVTAYDQAGNSGTGSAQVYVDYHRVYIPLVLRNWVWWYQYDRYEPNDTPAQAYGPLSSTQVITAYIWDTTDRDDYYWFQPSQSAPVTITLTNIPANCDFDLYVYYYQGGYQTVAYSNKTGNVGEEVRFNATANTKYYVRVYPFLGSSDTQAYCLFVNW